MSAGLFIFCRASNVSVAAAGAAIRAVGVEENLAAEVAFV
jgi:hypothetical protein